MNLINICRSGRARLMSCSMQALSNASWALLNIGFSTAGLSTTFERLSLDQLSDFDSIFFVSVAALSLDSLPRYPSCPEGYPSSSASKFWAAASAAPAAAPVAAAAAAAVVMQMLRYGVGAARPPRSSRR